MKEEEIKITIYSVESRKGLIGKILPEKRKKIKELSFEELPMNLRAYAEIFKDYVTESKKQEFMGSPYLETIPQSAFNAGEKILLGLMKESIFQEGTEISLETKTVQRGKNYRYKLTLGL